MTGPRYSQAGVQALKHGEAAYRSGDRIVPARQAERLLEAVEALPPRHDCPGLNQCAQHPRWHVIVQPAGRRQVGAWTGIYPVATYRVYRPGVSLPEVVTVYHAEAIAYATERAREDQLAAIQDGGAGR